MGKKLKKLMALCLAAAFILSLAGCGSSKKEDTIVLGYIGPLTGESALWGGRVQYP